MILMPALIGITLLIIPVLNNKGERAASRRPWAIAVVLLSVTMIGSLWVAGRQSPWSPNFQALPLTEKCIRATSGPLVEGAQRFHDKASLSWHVIQGYGRG